MRNGGNLNLKRFFERYNIVPDSPLEFKYKTKAAQYYRNKVLLLNLSKKFMINFFS